MPVTDNSKEMCIPPPADPGECATGDAPISGEGLNGGKTEAAPAVPVATPIAEGSCFALLQKKRLSVFIISMQLCLLCEVWIRV